jgi:excisionase family DNA binding protein
MSKNDTEVKAPRMLSAAQVGEIYGVDAKTVSRWADEGRLGCIRTPGGHRRFFESEILQGIKESYAKTIPAPDERFV